MADTVREGELQQEGTLEEVGGRSGDGGLTVGSLFSGIGGFDLGFERAGMRTLWFCEQDPYRRAVLARHWPGVPCYEDVRSLVGNTERPSANAYTTTGGVGCSTGESGGGRGVSVLVPPIDLLCGGFPCQDISLAGRGAGIDGERSGLWGEFARLIRGLEPRWVVVENVPALTSRGLDRVLRDLASSGYDAEWDCLPASAFGAPHRRDRIWVVAYPAGERWGRQGSAGRNGAAGAGALNEPSRPGGGGGEENRQLEGEGVSPSGGGRRHRRGDGEPATRDADLPSSDPYASQRGKWAAAGESGWWGSEPDVGRVAHGIPRRVDRLASLGDSLVPQIAEWIGRRIIEAEDNA